MSYTSWLGLQQVMALYDCAFLLRIPNRPPVPRRRSCVAEVHPYGLREPSTCVTGKTGFTPCTRSRVPREFAIVLPPTPWLCEEAGREMGPRAALRHRHQVHLQHHPAHRHRQGQLRRPPLRSAASELVAVMLTEAPGSATAAKVLAIDTVDTTCLAGAAPPVEQATAT
jgi:hypothetical protein